MELSLTLSDQELDVFGSFLSRSCHKDQMGLTELHGFLTAITCTSANYVSIADWLPKVFGEDGPDFASDEESENITSLLAQFSMHIMSQLNGDIPCEPILYSDDALLASYLDSDAVLKQWCLSFIEGVRFSDT